MVQMAKNPPAMQTWIQYLGWENPLGEGKATLSRILGESPWTEEPGGLHPVGSQRVRQD